MKDEKEQKKEIQRSKVGADAFPSASNTACSN
jgi:hypothetical protein